MSKVGKMSLERDGWVGGGHDNRVTLHLKLPSQAYQARPLVPWLSSQLHLQLQTHPCVWHCVSAPKVASLENHACVPLDRDSIRTVWYQPS